MKSSSARLDKRENTGGEISTSQIGALQTNSSEYPQLVPIVVGFTGHRDIRPEDRERLDQITERLLSDLRSTFANSPIVVMTSLAEGVDRIAAQAALKLGLEIVVPSPFPIEEYERDFESDESLSEFRYLLNQAKSIVVTSDLKKNFAASYTTDRANYYALSGAYVAKYSAIVIAFWDGFESSFRGGTADVVSYRLQGIPIELDPDGTPAHASERGRLVIVKTPRIRHEEPLADAFSVRQHGNQNSVSFRSYWDLRLLDQANANLARQNLPPSCLGTLLTSEGVSRAKQTPQLAELNLISRYFLAADSLALNYQRRCHRSLRLTLSLALIAALGFQQLRNGTSMLLSLICVTAGFLAYFIHFLEISKNRVQEKFIHFRALAEAMRVQFYLVYSGTKASVYDSFLNSPADEGSWIRTALLTSSVGFNIPQQKTDFAVLSSVKSNWIDSQKKYFQKAFERQFVTNTRISSVKFSLLLFAALVLLVPNSFHSIFEYQTDGKIPWILLYQVVLGLVAVVNHVRSRTIELLIFRQVLRDSKLSDDLSISANFGFWSRRGSPLIACLLAIICVGLLGYSQSSKLLAQDTVASEFFVALGVFTASIAGALHLYSSRMAFGDHLKQYGRMLFITNWISKPYDRLLAERKNAEIHELLLRYGEEALSEIGDWFRLHRSRPIQVPKV